MLRIWAILFGLGFIFIGIASFFPQFLSNGLLFDLFEVNTLHNLFYVLSGVIAIMSATRHTYARYYFLLFGLLYLIAGVLGLVWYSDSVVLYGNRADYILHVVIGTVALYLSFSAKKVR